MTTPNVPDLPRVLPESTEGEPLASDGDGGTLRIDTSNFPDKGSHFIWGSKGGIFVDPADLIRNLSPFVPIPAEARKVISAWLARTVYTQQAAPRHADDLLATLATEGLLVGPGEPAASEGEPVAWLGATGEVFRDATNQGRMYGTGAERAMPRAEVEQYHGPLTPLYARPPVTAEPATAPSVTDATVGNSDATVSAPSVEQIGKVLGDHERWPTAMADLAEEIRALWSPAPGDAAGSRVKALEDALNRSAKHAATLRERAEKAEARVKQVEGTYEAACKDRERLRLEYLAPAQARVRELEERASNSHDRIKELESALAAAKHNYANMRDGRLNDTLVENERLRAALEAAEGRISSLLAVDAANDDQRQAESDMAAAERAIEVALDRDEKAARAHAAARAAVEADTTEEA